MMLFPIYNQREKEMMKENRSKLLEIQRKDIFLDRIQSTGQDRPLFQYKAATACVQSKIAAEEECLPRICYRNITQNWTPQTSLYIRNKMSIPISPYVIQSHMLQYWLYSIYLSPKSFIKGFIPHVRSVMWLQSGPHWHNSHYLEIEYNEPNRAELQ